MAKEEIQNQKPIAEIVLEVIQKECPASSPRLISSDLPMLLLDNMDNPEVSLSFRTVCEKYFPDGSGVEIPEGYNILEGAAMGDISELEIVDVEHCLELRMPYGERVYILPATEYPKIESRGLHKKTEKIENLLSDWFEQNQDDPEIDMQRNVARAFVGDCSFVIPMLAGLKPAGDVKEKNLRNKKTNTTRGMMALFNYFVDSGDLQRRPMYEGADEFVYFNPRAVQRIVAENEEIFAIYDINADTPAQEIIERFLSGSREESEIRKQIGLLLGFDKQSVTLYRGTAGNSDNYPRFPMRLWDVQYMVDEIDNNADYKELETKYKAIYAEIERQLTQGLSPLDIVRSLKGFESVTAIRGVTSDAVSGLPEN